MEARFPKRGVVSSTGTPSPASGGDDRTIRRGAAPDVLATSLGAREGKRVDVAIGTSGSNGRYGLTPSA